MWGVKLDHGHSSDSQAKKISPKAVFASVPFLFKEVFPTTQEPPVLLNPMDQGLHTVLQFWY